MKNVLKVSAVGDREIVVTRDFNAPRTLVWETMSKPEYLTRWLLGPPGWEFTKCEDDQCVGGRFRWEWRGPDGMEMAMTGVYREIVPPERCVRTESFESGCVPQMGEQLATLELIDRGEKTSLKLTVLYPSREARDGAFASGMERGMSASYDRLDDIITGVAV